MMADDIELRKAVHGAVVQSLTELLPDFVAQIAGELSAFTSKLEIKLAGLPERVGRDVMASTKVQSYIRNEILAGRKRKNGVFDDAMRDTCAKHKVTKVDLMSPSRKASLSIARQELMYVLNVELEFPATEVGSYLGGRDHTTILHGVKRHRERIATNTTSTEKPN